jgi:hypothetical protein
MGGMNFYGYVGNSPLGHIDPSGLWSTEAHNQIIWNALHPCGVSNVDIWRFSRAVNLPTHSPFREASGRSCMP